MIERHIECVYSVDLSKAVEIIDLFLFISST